MKAPRTLRAVIGAFIIGLGVWSATLQAGSVNGKTVEESETLQVNDSLARGILVFDAEQKSANATNGQGASKFIFSFTNASPDPVSILSGVGSCSCTTVQLPETPWVLQGGEAGAIGVTIDLTGKTGTLFKAAIIETDKGSKSLMMTVTIAPPPPMEAMTEAQRAAAMAASKVDRQAVFKGDCLRCHAKNVKGLYGQDLFNAVCAVCHEAKPRPTMVPDLHHLKAPTGMEFWRAWISVGKAGTLMPAFSETQGGPLSDVQIVSLATYLAETIPSVATPAATNSVAPAVK